jgi:two-component system, NtrC family, sensor histidine kinase HydH
MLPLYLVLAAPLALLLAIPAWLCYRDLAAVRQEVIQRSTDKLRVQAERRAGHIESALSREPEQQVDWQTLRDDPWLASYWNGIENVRNQQLYAAIVDNSGTIVRHTDPSRVGKSLRRSWYLHIVPEAGGNVVKTDDAALTGGTMSLDLRLPLVIGGVDMGDYHEGLAAGALEKEIADSRRAVWAPWLWIGGVALVLNIGAAFALLMLVGRYRDLLLECQDAVQARATQMGAIASGLAHEIRNPLQTMRINLHALRRSFTSSRPLSPEDQLAAIQESSAAVDSLDELMRDLMRFAAPEPGSQTELNLVAEVQATLNLLEEEMRGKQIAVTSNFAAPAVPISMSSGRLRQLLLNLLTFAQHNAGSSGRIDVEVAARNGAAEIVIVDHGPTLSPTDRANVFEPFQAARKTRSGLGLALVRTFASEAGGRVACEPHQPTGNRFRVQLPVSRPL